VVTFKLNKKMRRFAIGDIHGMHDKLIKCLESVNFDYKNDELIQLGDVVDRGGYSFECIEELLKIKNLKAILGNHDERFFHGLLCGQYDLYNQGAMETLRSYINNCKIDKPLLPNCEVNMSDIPDSHFRFFKDQLDYYIDEDNNCFVHGGFNRHKLIEETGKTHGHISDLFWDRDLWSSAVGFSRMKNNPHKFKIKNNFKEIFIGHTPTLYWDSEKPMKCANIWNLDTGCGKGGFLTIMNIETKEYIQF